MFSHDVAMKTLSWQRRWCLFRGIVDSCSNTCHTSVSYTLAETFLHPNCSLCRIYNQYLTGGDLEKDDSSPGHMLNSVLRETPTFLSTSTVWPKKKKASVPGETNHSHDDDLRQLEPLDSTHMRHDHTRARQTAYQEHSNHLKLSNPTGGSRTNRIYQN